MKVNVITFRIDYDHAPYSHVRQYIPQVDLEASWRFIQDWFLSIFHFFKRAPEFFDPPLCHCGIPSKYNNLFIRLKAWGSFWVPSSWSLHTGLIDIHVLLQHHNFIVPSWLIFHLFRWRWSEQKYALTCYIFEKSILSMPALLYQWPY